MSSESRTVVPITICGFSFKVSICLFKGVPPIKSAVFKFVKDWIACFICEESSNVGETIMIFTWSESEGEFKMFEINGSANAKVFPVPVSDWKTIFFLSRIYGITVFWTGVGSVMLIFFKFSTRTGFKRPKADLSLIKWIIANF